MSPSGMSAPQRKPLVTGIAALFALSSPIAASASTWIVDRCDNDAPATSGDLGTKTGSLRFAVANAASGDTVDMTAIGCSTITLSTGAVTVAQDDLTLKGPGANYLTLSAKYTKNNQKYYSHDRIFNHTGTGTLALYDMTVAKGYQKDSAGTARGGCIFSSGTVDMFGVTANGCSVHTDTGYAFGGAVYAQSAFIKYSNVTNGRADGGAGGQGNGGGVFTTGNFLGKYSTFAYNAAAAGASGSSGYCGGLRLEGDSTLKGVTISHNTASGNGAGLCLTSPVATDSLLNSTVSSNTATGKIGGMYANSATLTVGNSTIAFNVAQALTANEFSPGLTLFSAAPMNVTLQSSVLTDNAYGPTGSAENDLTASGTVTFNAPPAYNLVRISNVASLPSDTKFFQCALLGPLRNNGGPTQTHALLSTSPAIDAGANPSNFKQDQRGVYNDSAPYLYPRVSGMSAQADIGAYEVNQDDIIFNASFEGCLVLY